MTTADELPIRVARLEERMKTQHARGVTHIANQSRHHTSQIASIDEKLANISIDAAKRDTETAKREIRILSITLGGILGASAIATTILGILIGMQH